MLHIIKRFPLFLLSNTLLVLTEGLLEAALIFAFIPVIDLLIKPDLTGISIITQKAIKIAGFIGLPAKIETFLVIFFLFNVIKVIFQFFARYSILKTKYAVVGDILLGTFEDFFNARWYFFSSSKDGTLLNTFNREIMTIGEAFGSMALFFAGIIKLAFYLIVPLYLSWQVTSISIAAALIFMWPFILMGKFSYRLGTQNTSMANQLMSIVHESLISAKIILGYGNQRKSVKTLRNVWDEMVKPAVQSQAFGVAIPLLYYPFGLLVLTIGIFTARKFALPLSEIIVLFYSLMKIVPSFGELAGLKNSLENFFPSYEQINILRERAKQLEQRSGDREFTGFKDEMLIRGLSFAYPDHKPTLVNINARIKKGKMIALVGESGSGKSTLIDMIMGFNEPSAGLITIDGVPLADFEINSYRHRIGYVPQDNILFNTTIYDNLLWAKEDAGREEVEHACRQANAEEFIVGFPKGYDTVVGNRGVRLSGGQLQRIALARGILRRPDILILDEATSSLDTHSERLIQEAIENIAKETTVIAIAHRLSTVINADYIYVLKKGHIIEEGNYSQLVGNKGEFYNMVQQQKL